MDGEIDEISDQQLDRLDAEKRHKEMTSLMKQLISTVKSDDSSVQISQEVSKNSEALKNFIASLQPLLQKDTKQPDITVHTNQEQVVSEISKMSDELLKSLNKLNEQLKFVDNKPKEFEHKVIRNSASGLIETIISKSK